MLAVPDDLSVEWIEHFGGKGLFGGNFNWNVLMPKIAPPFQE